VARTVLRGEERSNALLLPDRMPVAERRQESGDSVTGSSAGGLPYNWPDTGPGARTRQGADVGRWAYEDNATLTPALKDKLDAIW
jgi:hypothetical protein